MLKNIYRKYAMQLGLIGLIIGLILLIISSLGIFAGDLEFVKESDPLQSFFNIIGDYIYWLFIGMVALSIAGGWVFFDLTFKLRKFNNLISTTSKATFVRNQIEIEELAWHLGPKYMDIVYEKKRKFRIKN